MSVMPQCKLPVRSAFSVKPLATKDMTTAVRVGAVRALPPSEEDERHGPVTSLHSSRHLENSEFDQDWRGLDHPSCYLFGGRHSHTPAPYDRTRRHGACVFSGHAPISRR